MSRDHRASPVAQVSLVNAFIRLANLQANPYEQNLGDVPGALLNLRKAMEIAEPLAASHPHDPAVLLALARAQDARGEILSFAEDNTGAAQSLQASSQTYDRLLAAAPPTPALLFEAGGVSDTLGDVQGQDTGFADPAAALQSYRRAIDFDGRALRLDPNFLPARRGMVSMQMKVGNVELDTAPAVALADFRGAMARLDALPPAERARLSLTRTRALLLRKQAFALGELGQYAAAAPLYDASGALYRRIADADPKDIRALRDLDRLFTNQAFNDEAAANPLLAPPAGSAGRYLAQAEAVEAERQALLRHLLESSTGDAALRQELAGVTIRLDALHGGGTGAQQRDREALEVLRSAARDSRATPMQLDLAFHAFSDALPVTLRDPSEALRDAERGAALTHRRDAAWLLSLAQACRATGDPARAAATAAEGLALLPNDPDDQDFRLRLLLQAQIDGLPRQR